jgi:pyruvate/2-oxoacid:ferredoxin oxidoreductase beta subunit
MTMKMVLETVDQRPYRNIDAGQCPGCPSNLATKLVMQIVFQAADRQQTGEPILFGQGCGIGRDILQRSGIGTHDSACVGLRLAMEMRGIERPIVVIDGDGQIDMGFDDFTAAFQLGYPYLHIICDNQAYAASGTHATGMTDLLARVSTRPTGRVGKPDGRIVVRKQPAMMIKFSGARYAATASTSHLPDVIRKVERGLREMPAFIQVFTPCNVSWGYDDDQAALITRLGVTSGLWPLWEWGDDGFRRTIPFAPDGDALRQYLRGQRRYAHLKEADIPLVEQYVGELNDLVDRLERGFGSAR